MKYIVHLKGRTEYLTGAREDSMIVATSTVAWARQCMQDKELKTLFTLHQNPDDFRYDYNVAFVNNMLRWVGEVDISRRSARSRKPRYRRRCRATLPEDQIRRTLPGTRSERVNYRGWIVVLRSNGSD